MEFLGIGPLELILVVVLALVLIGPRDMAKLARQAGLFLNKLYRSATWRTMNEASREIRNLPNRLAREAELDSVQKDLQQAGQTLSKDLHSVQSDLQAWTPGSNPPVPPIPMPAGETPANGSPSPEPSKPPTDAPPSSDR